MKQFIPDKVYDVLKWVALVVLPAISFLYLGIASIWGLPYGDEVSRTITYVSGFIGALLGVSSVGYYINKNNQIEE